MSELFSEYLNKPLKVHCKDGRIIYGVLVCVSAPYSIILQSSICEQQTSVKIDLQFHYTPQQASKPFLVGLEPLIRNSYENLSQTRGKLHVESDEAKKNLLLKEISDLEALTLEAKKYEQQFMRDKYYIGSLAIPGNQIDKIQLLI